MRIVALSLDAYGDLVLRQPLLCGLLDLGHEITLVVRPAYADLVPYIDGRLKVFSVDLDPYHPLAAGTPALERLRGIIDRIRLLAPEVVVSLPYNRTPADEWILRHCGIARRAAFFPANRPESLIDLADTLLGSEQALPFGSMVNEPVAASESTSELAKNEILFHVLSQSHRSLATPRLALGGDNRAAAAAWLDGSTLAGLRYAVVAPAGTAHHPVKQMPPHLAAAAIEHLWEKHRVGTILAGVESERTQLDAVLSRLENVDRDAVVLWVGGNGSLGALLGLLERAEIYVGADLGTMHFAAAVGIPVAALFGGGHFPRFAPAALRWAAVTKRLPCFGCEWNCIFETVRCIGEVSESTWLGAIDAVMAGESPGWVLEPAGLDESTARAAKPEFDRIRTRLLAMARELHTVEVDRAKRLSLIETQDAQMRALQNRLTEVEADRAQRLQKLIVLDREHQLLHARVQEIEADREERLRLVHRLSEELAARGEALDRVETQLKMQRSAGEAFRALVNAILAWRPKR